MKIEKGCVENRERLLLAGSADLNSHVEIEEAVEDEDESHVAIFFGKQFH